MVDVATLTGACVVALGHHHSGLFTADDTLAAQLLAASAASLDPCWRMPLDEEYEEALKSNFADMGNVGGRAGGAITAAMFLRKFTGKYRWAHLDIAGTAWKSGAAKGATGRPVPLLTHFVLAQAAETAARIAMTRVSFHFNVPHRLGYACRLLRKATRQNARVTVTAPVATLAELDAALWTFDPTEFVPHVLVRDGQALPDRLRDTPVCLVAVSRWCIAPRCAAQPRCRAAPGLRELRATGRDRLHRRSRPRRRTCTLEALRVAWL